MKHKILLLVVGLPLTAVLMGMITLYLAITHADPGIQVDKPALTKTSWHAGE